MSRVLFLIVALVTSVPALAQTRVVSLKAGDAVGAPALSTRGDRIAARVGPDRIAVWSLPDGRLLQEMKVPQRPASLLFGHADEIVVALADGSIEVRAIATGAAVRRMEAGVRQPVLAISADGRLLASSGAGQIRLWDSSGALLRTFGHEFGSVMSLAFSPDGSLLASAGSDTNVHLWDVSTGKQRASLRDQLLSTFDLTFTADARNLVIAGANGAIEIVDVQTASIVRRFRAERHAVGLVRLSPDGRSIGAAYFDPDGAALPAPLAVWELASGKQVRRVTPAGASTAIAGFNADGRLLYVMTKDQEMTVWALPGSSSPASSPATPDASMKR